MVYVDKLGEHAEHWVEFSPNLPPFQLSTWNLGAFKCGEKASGEQCDYLKIWTLDSENLSEIFLANGLKLGPVCLIAIEFLGIFRIALHHKCNNWSSKGEDQQKGHQIVSFLGGKCLPSSPW